MSAIAAGDFRNISIETLSIPQALPIDSFLIAFFTSLGVTGRKMKELQQELVQDA